MSTNSKDENKITTLRKLLRISSKELSRRSGISYSTILSAEEKDANPTLKTLVAITKAFHQEGQPSELLWDKEKTLCIISGITPFSVEGVGEKSREVYLLNE